MIANVEIAPFGFRLETQSGVSVYRQIIDQVHRAIATGLLKVGDQIPTVRQVAVDLAINPNTVLRAYREMEIRGTVDTQQVQAPSLQTTELKILEASARSRSS
jgi:GntR family transcriptional regulator